MKKYFLLITKISLTLLFLLSVFILWKTPTNEYESLMEIDNLNTLPQDNKTGIRALLVLLPIIAFSILSVVLWKQKVGKIFFILCGILVVLWVYKFHNSIFPI